MSNSKSLSLVDRAARLATAKEQSKFAAVAMLATVRRAKVVSTRFWIDAVVDYTVWVAETTTQVLEFTNCALTGAVKELEGRSDLPSEEATAEAVKVLARYYR